MKEAFKAIEEANRFADLIELRMDYLKEIEFESLTKGCQRPFVVTNRRKEEGGRFKGSEEKRICILKKAIDLGADYIDVEVGTKISLLQSLIKNKRGAKIILSFHNFRATPSQKELKRLCNHMNRLGANIIKIVTFARSWEDNLLILSLIPFAREKRKKIVAFCMGEKGRMSRVFAPIMGAEWTYASLNKNRASAPGQLTVYEMKDIWERLR